MIVSNSHKFIYSSCGKVATCSMHTAIKKALGEQGGTEVKIGKDRHLPALTIREEVGAGIWEQYFTFTLVRNPYDWAVSSFLWFIKTGKHKSNSINPFGENYPYVDGNVWPACHLTKDGLIPTSGFETVAWWYKNGGRRNGLKHVSHRTQLNFISDKNGKELCDYVGKLENLEESLAEISKRTGLKIQKLPKKNISLKSDRKHYSEYYTDEGKKLVEKYWQEDIDRFNYSFEDKRR